MLRQYEIRSGGRAIRVQGGVSPQQVLVDYLRSLGCRHDELVRLGTDAVAWRGARYTATLDSTRAEQ